MNLWNRMFGVSVALSLLSTSAMAQRQSADKVLPSQQQLSRLGLERAWWGQATLNPSRDKVKHLTVDEETAYVQASSGIVTAFDAETGERKWAVRLGRFDQPSFPAISNQDLALVIVGSTMYGLERATGRTLWTLVLPGQPSTGPSIDDNQVYVGTLDGSVYAFSLRRIRKLYQQQRLPQWSHEALEWRYQAGKEVTSPPVVTGRVVNFCSRDGSLYSISAFDRKLIYQLETDAPIVAALTRSGRMQFMASEDNSFYALNVENGRVIWEFTSGLPIRKSPVAINDDLFIMPDRGGMYCLEAPTGSQRWWQPNQEAVIAVAGDAIFTSDSNGNLVRIARDSGALSGSIALRSFSKRVTNERTDRVYMATESGLVVAMRLRGESIPVYHKFPDRLPILPLIEPEEADSSAEPKTDSENAANPDQNKSE